MGCIGDLGWYCAKVAVTFLGVERTKDIRDVACFGSVFEDAPDVLCEANGAVVFADGSTMTFDCGFKSVSRQRIEIVGENGTVRINDFVVPNKHYDMHSVPEGADIDNEYELETGRKGEDNRPQPSESEMVTVEEPKSSKGGMVLGACMVHELVKLIKEKDADRQEFWTSQTTQTQRIVDALYKDCTQRLKTKAEKGE